MAVSDCVKNKSNGEAQLRLGGKHVAPTPLKKTRIAVHSLEKMVYTLRLLLTNQNAEPTVGN